MNIVTILRVVLNLFTDFIVYLALFISLSMHQKTQMKSNNAFFEVPRCMIISLSMQFQGAPALFPTICTSVEWQQQEISAAPALKIRNKRFL